MIDSTLERKLREEYRLNSSKYGLDFETFLLRKITALNNENKKLKAEDKNV